ncbi:hypothetical protein M8818_000334 [Zalaria obscura]|uniref:Uncharacterized protein n=1 Tax=Zalaria obscura TaxID=2024903 RepID=A0ACC3SN03_9PEZI
MTDLGPVTEPTTNGSISVQNESVDPALNDLLQRCQTLYDELETFRRHLKDKRQEHEVELGHFRGTVRSELKALERLNKAAGEHVQSVEATQHTVASSNLPFLETLWNTVKRTNGLLSLQKRFYWKKIGKGQAKINGNGAGTALDKRKQSALVDVVTRDGLEWIKVSLITNNRLLHDMAKQGWEVGDSSSEEGDSAGNEDDDEYDIPLVKMAKDLLRAAEGVRIRTRHPQICLILPRVEEGEYDEIDRIIADLRGMGITIRCSDDAPEPTPLGNVIDDLLSDPFAGLTETLDIDCTILLAIVSDFSHCDVNAEPWFHRALKRQVEIEEQENLLPNLLYPAIAGHKLVCTDEAAKRMREIVDTIGTPGEKARTQLLMGDYPDMDVAQYRSELAKWSKFEVPANLNLPIQAVDKDSAAKALPQVAEKVKPHLTAINQSVFLYGWSAGNTVVTSNRTVVKQIEHVLDEHAESEKDWPSIWLCPTARSLVGKEKGRRE